MNKTAVIFATILAMMSPTVSAAMQLDFPRNASLVDTQTVGLGSYQMPVSGWNGEQIDTILAEGEVIRQAWKISASGLTSLQILDPLKLQLADAGFELVFECETQACGGFDFRFETDVMPEPVMHVDLGDFRYLAAKRVIDGQPEYISLLVSRSQNAGYIQLTRVGAPTETGVLVTSTKNPALTTVDEVLEAGVEQELPLDRALDETGYFILEDLQFETGSSDLGSGEFSSLSALADYLKLNPNHTVAVVGHTDAVGSLEVNIALSKKRAGSVMQRLVSELGVEKAQISAEGNGFLSPRSSNQTDGGRAQNRRVEVIVTSTQ